MLMFDWDTFPSETIPLRVYNFREKDNIATEQDLSKRSSS